MLAQLIQANKADDQDAILKLYWNRAGVKRELASLKREHFELLEKLEQQEGAILRAQNQLEGLERLLTNPLAAANAMVYFQLRHLWRVGALKVEQFARELKHQREQREKTQLHSTVLAKRNRRLEAIREKLDELTEKRRLALEEFSRLEQRLENMNALFRLFAGHSIRNRIQGAQKNRDALEERIAEYDDIIEKIQGEPLPEPDGLSLENRRLINIAIIALAQHLVLHFADNNLARLARKASKRAVGDMKFGDRRVCDQMVEVIRQRVDLLTQDKQLADKVKRRADKLVNAVSYRHESDAVPMAEALSEIAVLPVAGSGQTALAATSLSANVVEDDYWDLMRVLY